MPVTVEPPRPASHPAQQRRPGCGNATPSPVHLGSQDDLPISDRLVFFLKSRVPADFPRNEKVEVAAVNGSFHTVLSIADGTLMLEDAKTAVGTVDPLTRFGSSAFGPIQARALSPDGTSGDWLPLGTLVRLPSFKELHCSRSTTKPCSLSGSDLFLITSVASTPDFANPTDVPSDFTGTQINVPHPVSGALYLKLRDDTATVQTLNMPVIPSNQTGAVAPPAAPAQPEGPPPTGSDKAEP